MTATVVKSWDVAGACVQRVDHGAGKPLTLAEAVEAVEHPLDARTRAELVEIVAYLSAQVVGYQHNQNAEATLAMAQVVQIAKDYAERVR